MRSHLRTAPRGGVPLALVVFVTMLVWPALCAQPALGALRADPVVDPLGPKAAIVAPALVSTSSKSAAFKVSWSAVPALPSAGYNAWRVEYREPGVSYWLVWQSATTAASGVFPGEAGHAYEFRAAAAKTGDASVVGPWSTARPAAVPADDTAFAVTKTWKRTSLSGAYCGKVRTATAKGATATYAFNGAKAALVAPRGRAYGKVAVYVRSANGSGGWTSYKLVKTVDLYASKARARVATVFGSYDPSVRRQVKLVVTGTKNRRSTSTKVSLDGLAVYGAPRTETWHHVDIRPSTPSVVITEQLQFTASIDGCVDQRVEWTVLRYDRFGKAYTDGAGAITAAGLYTAPGLPTVTSGEAQRTYLVSARGVANPDQVYGARTVTVTLGQPPVVQDVQPRSAPAGATVTITGQHFVGHGGEPQALFNGVEAVTTSVTDTRITAVVPGGWQTWKTSQQMRVWVRTFGVDSSYPADLLFTVTGIKPMPPSPWTINAAGGDDDNASVGDTLRIYGGGFAPAAADNVVRFGGGVTTKATSYVADPYAQDYGTLHVTVPAGAASGSLTFQRLDGDGGWSTADMPLVVKAATAPTAALHPSFNGYVTGPRMARNGYWSGMSSIMESWLLQGTGFTKLRIADYSTTTTGVFWLDMRRNGVTASRIMRAVSDTQAVQHLSWGPQDSMPDSIFGDAQGGDVVEIRIRGDELTNRYERASGWVPVTVGERPVWGAFHDLPVAQLAGWWNPGHQLAQGDWLKLSRSSGPATQMVTCPGLWPGQLPLGEDGAGIRLVRLAQKGSYTLTNVTMGTSTTFTVGDIGSIRTVSYGSFQATDVQASGLLLRNGGASLEIPPGSLPADQLPAGGYYIVTLDHAGSDRSAFDPTLTDGGRSFSLWISPEPTRLLKPITVTVPYDPAGRATTPFLGAWDPSSSLYYDYGLPPSQIDATNHRMTIVLPAGDYSGGGGALRAAPESSTKTSVVAASDGRATTVGFFPVSAFNLVFKAIGAVSSSVSTSGNDLVWHPAGHPTWGIRVDAVTDPTSSSYVPFEKAQEVLRVAAETWTNLEGKGWREPEAMISITVRDYGDPGDYQGATTKGVFGQPWMYVNSRLTMGKRLDTAVAHEMGHVFQRQLTTNISTQWIDEAVAEWVAWDTLGAGSDLQATLEAGCDFPRAGFPETLSYGYSQEQAYGAGAFIIWLADTYGPTAVLNIYDTLAFSPTYWYDAAATFEEATGRTVSQLVAELAPEFWFQTYDPIKTYGFWSREAFPFSTLEGKTLNHSMPPDSSRCSSVAPTAELRPTLNGNSMVARAPGLPAGATVQVYIDSSFSSQIPAAPVLIGTLSSLTPVVDLGVFDSADACYRLIAVTPAGAPLTAAVTVEPVRLSSVSPASGSKTGGYQVTLEGCGFGDQPAIVMVGAAVVSGEDAIMSWTDTRIVFKMPNMGTATGAQSVEVRPDVGGPSNSKPLTLW